MTLRQAADILFVIDNSGSMGGYQGVLARHFPAFVSVLEREDRRRSLRIGVTTTDGVGLRLSSCRERLDEFIWQGRLAGEPLTIDSREDGCLSVCPHEDLQFVGEGADFDNPPPWLEPHTSRLSTAEAFACVGPQGINGFGFEAPLESMRQVLVDNPRGFVRDDALLAIIIVTDEADCSMPEDHVFQMFDARELWSDPDADHLTSAVCWNAGVSCEPDAARPGVYSTCKPADIGWDGTSVEDPEEAVLYPVDRYVEMLHDVAREKERRGGNGQVHVAVIAGVPLDYPTTGAITYEDSVFPEFNREYGIGPGCGRGSETLGNPAGIPPVRLRDFAASFRGDSPNLYSICSGEYATALQEIGEAIDDLAERACVHGCVVDTSPTLAGVQPECDITEIGFDGTPTTVYRPVLPCSFTNDGWRMPEGETICARYLGDPDRSTRTPADDLSASCRQAGANLEVVVERAEDHPHLGNPEVRVECVMHGRIGVMCDDL